MNYLTTLFKASGIGLFIALFILLIIAGPFISIWSLNTLFGLKIAYGFFEWLAMLWVGVVLFPKNTKKSD